MRRQTLAIICVGLLVCSQQQLAAAAAARQFIHTFPYTPPAAITVQPPAAPTSNAQLRAAPQPMGLAPPGSVPASLPPLQPAAGQSNMRLAGQGTAAAAAAGPSNMQLAGPGTAAAAAAALPAAANIPYAPSIPYNPNSLYRPLGMQAQQGQQGSAPIDTSQIPQSHPVGMFAQTAAAMPGRQRGVASMITSGAQALSALSKRLRGHSSAGSDSSAGQLDSISAQPSSVGPQPSGGFNTMASPSSSSSSSSGTSSFYSQSTGQPHPGAAALRTGISPMSAPQGAVSVANVGPQHQVVFPSGALPWTSQQGMVGTAAIPAVRAVDKPASAPAAAAPAAAVGVASMPSSTVSTAGVHHKQPGQGFFKLSNPPAVPAGSVQGSFVSPAPHAASAAVSVAAVPGAATMQPLSPLITRVATNNMGAPVSGPLGGATYMPMHQPAAAPAAVAASPKAAGSGKVSTAATAGLFSSTPAPTVLQIPGATGAGFDSLQQHFSGPKPPQYAPLPPTLHVAPAKGSKAKSSSIGPSIDDVSAAAGAPVAQLTWTLPKKTHVAFAPAADLIRAAPVSPFEMPSSMLEEQAGGQEGGRGIQGAVSHHLTPTWAPATI